MLTKRYVLATLSSTRRGYARLTGAVHTLRVVQRQILNSSDPGESIPRTRVMVMKSTVLPRILPASQTEIDAFRGRLEAGIDDLLTTGKTPTT